MWVITLPDIATARIRQVTKVTAVSIPLAVLVGISEECGFRGFLPLLLAAKTGWPMPAVVVVSGAFCGVRLRLFLSSGVDRGTLATQACAGVASNCCVCPLFVAQCLAVWHHSSTRLVTRERAAVLSWTPQP